jgi:hypothetical protein
MNWKRRHRLSSPNVDKKKGLCIIISRTYCSQNAVCGQFLTLNMIFMLPFKLATVPLHRLSCAPSPTTDSKNASFSVAPMLH